MVTLFENEDFILKSTGHDYDFVGIIETKTENPLTFFFAETLAPIDENDEDSEFEVCEDETEFYDMCYDMSEEDAEDHASMNCLDFFQTRDDKSTGFLSDCRERGRFLALVKSYCPGKLKEIPWA